MLVSHHNMPVWVFGGGGVQWLAVVAVGAVSNASAADPFRESGVQGRGKSCSERGCRRPSTCTADTAAAAAAAAAAARLLLT